jgi:hypothetical protein
LIVSSSNLTWNVCWPSELTMFLASLLRLCVRLRPEKSLWPSETHVASFWKIQLKYFLRKTWNGRNMNSGKRDLVLHRKRMKCTRSVSIQQMLIADFHISQSFPFPPSHQYISWQFLINIAIRYLRAMKALLHQYTRSRSR